MKKLVKIKKNGGMSYTELIVVLAIFSVMSFIIIFSYSTFQARVDIKNLASEIALKIVEAQKSSLSGKLPSVATGVTWKPSYGVYFSSTTTKKFIYFVDLDNSSSCNSANCNPPSYSIGGEVLNIINITKGNTIPATGLEVSGSGCPATVANFSIVFKRPSSSPTITSSTSLVGCTVSYFTVNVNSPKGPNAKIKIYPSGRIQVDSGGSSSSPAPATCNGLPATIEGTSAGEQLDGTNGSDVIVGNGGNDTINGGNNNDTICAGNGNDTINGDNGSDTIIDTGGNNNVNGGNQNDNITTGSGNDTINGDNGTDTCNADGGINTLISC